MSCHLRYVFFFKQKTAYEMRNSDWSADVISSDLERVVLRRRAHHRGAADVDILDDVVARRALGDGRGEGVEVDDDEVDRADAVRVHRRDMRDIVAHREAAAVGRRVERLDAAVHHPGNAGETGDV